MPAETLAPGIELHHGDCIDLMRSIPAGSYDAVICDPPYGLGADRQRGMGVVWDGDVPNIDTWLEVRRLLRPGGHVVAVSAPRTYHKLATRVEDAGLQIVDLLTWLTGNGSPKAGRLKPAATPICLARSEIGNLNIDAARVPTDEPHGIGRWPANACHDGSDEVIAEFPQSGQPGRTARRDGEASATSRNKGHVGFKMRPGMRRCDVGSAARFFYCARASMAERGKDNNHVSVKPVALLKWLCRLVCPTGGRVLDPFAGSGSTALACIAEGMECTLIEREANYCKIIRRRIADANKSRAA